MTNVKPPLQDHNVTYKDNINSTTLNESKPEEVWLPSSWIYSEVINVFLLLAISWIFRSLFLFGSRNGMRFNLNKKKSNSNSNSPAQLIMLALVCLFSSIITLLISQLVIIVDYLGWNGILGGKSCSIAMDISIISYVVSYSLTYIFLWFRMDKLYTQPSLSRLRTKLVRSLSYLVLVLIFVGAVAHNTVLIKGINHEMTEFGCIQNRSGLHHDQITIASYVLKAITNTLLFGLFYYPLKHHKDKCESACNEPANRRSSTGKSNTGKRLLRAMRLATYGMVSCVLSDLVVTLVDVKVLAKVAPGAFINAIWDINLFVNLLCIVVCFDGFKESALLKRKSRRTSKEAEEPNDKSGAVRTSTKASVKSSTKRTKETKA